MMSLCFGRVVNCDVASFQKAIESVDEMENHKVSGIPTRPLSLPAKYIRN